MKLAKYIGLKASVLLTTRPFKNWPVKRRVDDDSDPPEVRIVFVGCGLEFCCDREEESVHSIFIESEEHAGIVLSEVPFQLRRDEVLEHFGSPSKSGKAMSDPILGKYGPWDRFKGPEYTVHVQYKVGSDSIKMITIMRNDVVP